MTSERCKAEVILRKGKCASLISTTGIAQWMTLPMMTNQVIYIRYVDE